MLKKFSWLLLAVFALSLLAGCKGAQDTQDTGKEPGVTQPTDTNADTGATDTAPGDTGPGDTGDTTGGGTSTEPPTETGGQ